MHTALDRPQQFCPSKRMAIRNLRRAAHHQRARVHSHGNAARAGNGSAFRVAPRGVLLWRPISAVLLRGVEQLWIAPWDAETNPYLQGDVSPIAGSRSKGVHCGPTV